MALAPPEAGPLAPQPRLSAGEARRILVQGRFGRSRAITERDVCHQELLGLPCALVAARIRTGSGASAGDERLLRCLVDGLGGGAVWAEGVVDAAIKTSLASQEAGHPTHLTPLPAALPMQRCVREGTDFISRRVSLVQRGRRWDLVGPVEARPLVYPYWVLTFRRRGRWDLRAADAISGERASGIVKRSLIAGLVELDRDVGGSASAATTGRGTL